ncbi:MAG: hypothetical protein CFE32_17165, partial [Alphaproteobacteria bacterium PA3]
MILSRTLVIAFNELFLILPMFAVMLLAWHRKYQRRVLVAALFSFLYLLGVLLATQVLSKLTGWWWYGVSDRALLGMPVQLWLGWALVWGPLTYLALSRVSPWILMGFLFALDVGSMPLLNPLVVLSDEWLAGEFFLLFAAFLPAQYLARWTFQDRLLPWRAALLAIGYGCCAFLVLPSAIMKAMGDSWVFQWFWPTPVYFACVLGLFVNLVIGLSAVQLFVVHGGCTPIPLDNTKRIVRTGLYAYFTNPMQSSTAATWILLGFVFKSFWVCAAAAMAYVFVKGLVRWHHRQDLAVRFPVAWQEYQANVPSWRPRWRPWIPVPACIKFNPRIAGHRWLRTFHLRPKDAG